MDYVKSFDLFGTLVTLIPCIPKSGAPTTETEAAVGCLYMNTDDGVIYKCVAAADGVYTWKPVATGGGGGGISEEEVGSMINEALEDYPDQEEAYGIVADYVAEYGLITFEEFMDDFHNEFEYAIEHTSEEGGYIDIIAENIIKYLPIYNGEVV